MGTARGSFLRRWRLLAIDGFEVDVPDSKENAAEFGYAGSGDNRSAFPKARVVLLLAGVGHRRRDRSGASEKPDSSKGLPMPPNGLGRR